jgi:hypothetical protein
MGKYNSERTQISHHFIFLKGKGAKRRNVGGERKKEEREQSRK